VKPTSGKYLFHQEAFDKLDQPPIAAKRARGILQTSAQVIEDGFWSNSSKFESTASATAIAAINKSRSIKRNEALGEFTDTAPPI
jgi:hypothetical protein